MRYNEMDAKMEKVRDYANAKIDQCKAVWADQCTWLKSCRQMVRGVGRLRHPTW